MLGKYNDDSTIWTYLGRSRLGPCKFIELLIFLTIFSIFYNKTYISLINSEPILILYPFNRFGLIEYQNKDYHAFSTKSKFDN